jgi:hypothetical protein
MEVGKVGGMLPGLLERQIVKVTPEAHWQSQESVCRDSGIPVVGRELLTRFL